MKLFNTLSRQKEELNPIKKGEVKFYNCGLTVYSHPHIGNWVGYIYWDVLTRLLEYKGYKVIRVQNITDVGHLVSDDDDGEDKMEKGARKEGKTAWQIADKYIEIANDEAFNKLSLERPRLIRATDCIEEQIEFVKKLEISGFTYKIKDEGVYFDTSKLKDYGKLAKLDIEGLDAGSRVAINGKKSVTDFALWKFSPKDKKRDMEWDSPWGKGFPGWHLECSAIAMLGLGEQIDIHAGGTDHIPVHHTNEIAQTEALTGKPFSKIWLHNNHLKVDGGKMSKSLGNVYTIKDIENKGFSVVAFKLLVLSKNYKTEGNFTWEILESSQNRLINWLRQSDKIWQIENDSSTDVIDEIINALSNDLDTPETLSIIDKYFYSLEKYGKSANKQVLESIEKLLGVKLIYNDLNDSQKLLIKDRKKARENKNWENSDKIRAKLLEQGIAIEDSPNHGQIWSKARL